MMTTNTQFVRRFTLVWALFTTTFCAAHAQNLTNGLAAYYPFSGNASDASGNGMDGAVQGAALIADRYGFNRSAYRFNGSSWIQLPDGILPVTAPELTLSAWVLADRAPYNLQAQLMDLTTRRGECGLAILPGEPAVWNFGVHLQNAGWQDIPSPMNSNVWTHLVGTYKQGQYMQFWVNGSLVGSNSIPDDPLFLLPGYQLNSAVGIYDYDPTPYLGFNGAMDDIRIYNRALSAAEVRQLYLMEGAGPVVSIIKAVKPSFALLSVGTNYQLQVSADLVAWTNQGTPFIATNSTMTFPQYWDVDNWSRLFFRLQVSP